MNSWGFGMRKKGCRQRGIRCRQARRGQGAGEGKMKIDIYNTDRKYKIIYADPPWEYKESGGGRRGTAGLPYPAMAAEEICRLPVRRIADETSMLFIWATFKKIRECLKTIEAWGYEYYGLAFDWLKTGKGGSPCFGMGYYTRQNNEVCLIGVRKERDKRIGPVSRSVSCVIRAERREHSRKPDEARERIVEICGSLPRVELFARQQAEGWDCWGNEI